ncbi:MAG: S8 family serine peptidase, partial [Actinomycetota bacterium]|nr:S8 family serine peptidase [Actinomycetota bacterium]
MVTQVGFGITGLPEADADPGVILEEPLSEDPVPEEPAGEDPVPEEPVAEDPVVEEPVVEEPVAEDPVVEEPVVEEPVLEEPVIEDSVVEEPVVEEPVPEDPAVDEPVVSTEEAVVEHPSLTIVKDADMATVSVDGETITYTITVTNTGDVDLTTVVVDDVFADGATLTSGDTNTNDILETTEIWVYTADYDVTQADLDAGADLVNVATVATDQTDEQQDDATTTITPDLSGPSVTYLVKFAPGAASEGRQNALKTTGGTSVGTISALGIELVDFPASSAAAKSKALEKNPNVVYVEENFSRSIAGDSNDTEYAGQWSLPQIGWDLAYEVVYPAGSATVAVLDTGVDSAHEDLAGNVVAGTSIIDGSDPMSDPNGHGTALAGIVGAKTGNNIGIAAVGYAGVKIMPVTVMAADGTGNDADIVAGVVWAADNGADVILMGFSNPGFSQALQDAADYAWSKGVVLVAATGNNGSSTPTYPAGMSAVMGVSSTTQSDTLAGSSNYGDTVFIGAPGVSIDTLTAGGGYGTITGTSVAAAEVAGVAALMMANDSSASNGQVVYRLGANAADAGTIAQTGNGRLNLNNALADTSTDSTKPAIVPDADPVEEPYVVAKAPDIEAWLNLPTAAWSGGTTVQQSNSRYTEGDALPLQYTQATGNPGPIVGGETHVITLRYDFGADPVEDGYFIDYLQSYDATQAGVTPFDDFPECDSLTAPAVD